MAEHVWKFIGKFEILLLDCFEGVLAEVVVRADGVERRPLLAFHVAAEGLVSHSMIKTEL